MLLNAKFLIYGTTYNSKEEKTDSTYFAATCCYTAFNTSKAVMLKKKYMARACCSYTRSLSPVAQPQRQKSNYLARRSPSQPVRAYDNCNVAHRPSRGYQLTRLLLLSCRLPTNFKQLYSLDKNYLSAHGKISYSVSFSILANFIFQLFQVPNFQHCYHIRTINSTRCGRDYRDSF